MLLEDFCFIAFIPAIADHNSGCDFFVEVLPHHAVLIFDNIEIGNIDNVIAMQRVFTVNCLRVGRPFQQFDVAGNIFLFALLVAGRPKVSATDISLTGTDTADRAFMCLLHYCCYPALIPLDQFRRAGTDILKLREQRLDFINPVCQSVILSKNTDRALEAAHAAAFCHTDNILHIRMAQNAICLAVVVVEYVMFHTLFSSFFILILIFISAKCLPNQGIYHIFLLFGECIEYVADRFLIIGFGTVF